MWVTLRPVGREENCLLFAGVHGYSAMPLLVADGGMEVLPLQEACDMRLDERISLN